MKRLMMLLLVIACAAEKPAVPPPPPAPKTQPPPSVAAARAILENAPELGEFEFTNAAYSLPTSRSAMSDDAKKVANNLRKAGWIAFDGSGNLLLTRGRDDKRFVMRSNGFVDIVPLAKKELGDVTAVRPGAEGPEIDFTWRWIANELGELITPPRYEGAQKATATLLWDGERWVVLRIVRR